MSNFSYKIAVGSPDCVMEGPPRADINSPGTIWLSRKDVLDDNLRYITNGELRIDSVGELKNVLTDTVSYSRGQGNGFRERRRDALVEADVRLRDGLVIKAAIGIESQSDYSRDIPFRAMDYDYSYYMDEKRHGLPEQVVLGEKALVPVLSIWVVWRSPLQGGKGLEDLMPGFYDKVGPHMMNKGCRPLIPANLTDEELMGFGLECRAIYGTVKAIENNIRDVSKYVESLVGDYEISDEGDEFLASLLGEKYTRKHRKGDDKNMRGILEDSIDRNMESLRVETERRTRIETERRTRIETERRTRIETERRTRIETENRTRIESIKNVMKNLGVSAKEATRILGIPEDQSESYIAKIG